MKQLFLSFIVVILSIFLSTQSYASEEKLVLIGGLDEYRVGKCNATSCSDGKEYDWGYLTSYYKLGNALNALNDSIPKKNRYEFRWSGDPITHNEGGNLKNKFENWFYKNVCERGSECNVSFISHSWGTIINSDFIASLPQDTSVNIRTVVTYASPVTGAQIKFNVTPFWATAVDKVNNSGGTWINVVNPKDVIAWDIPKTQNRKPDGTFSSKGRFDETFPVSNSEMDPKYLGTSFIRQCNPIESGFCSTLGSNFYKIWDSGLGQEAPSTLEEWNRYFMNTHFTENYEPERLVGYIKSNLPLISHFDGTGSLIDPQNSSGCDGCGKDRVILHSHEGRASTGFFQVFKISGICESISLEGLGSAYIEVRSWDGRGTNSKYYSAEGSSSRIPLSSTWNLVAFTTKKEIPAGSIKDVTASCLSGGQIPNVTEISNSPLKFDLNYSWGGNGSLINHTNNQYNGDTQAGYGRVRDTVAIFRDKKALSVFQVTNSQSCKKVKFISPVSFNLSWKLWHEKEWRGSKTVRNNDVFTFPTDEYWWILKVKAPSAPNTEKPRIDAICQ